MTPSPHAPPSQRVDSDRLQVALTAALGGAKVVSAQHALERMGRDFLRGSRAFLEQTSEPAAPLAAVRPASTEDVVAVVRLAHELAMPLVEYGGGTGLMGGARTLQPGIVLDLRAMDRIIAISAEDRTARVQAGVVLADLGDALAPHGLIVGHDPWTYPIATVGGAISTNGLGYLGARYGSMGDQVLGLTIVTANGEVVRTRSMPRSSTGPRLRSLFIGAEGTLGIITEAVLRVFPRPEATKLVAYEFAGFDEGYQAIQALFAAGITPAMTDFGQTYAGSRLTDALVTPAGALGLLNLAFQGLQEEVRAVGSRACAVLDASGGVRLPLRNARRFWEERHVVAEEIHARQRATEAEREAWLPEGVQFDFMHVALPPSAVIEYRRRSEPLLLSRGISIGEWGLWNQPELFSMTLFRRAKTADDARQFAEGMDAALLLAQEMGGSMEYCHGAGIKLAHLMGNEHGSGMDLLRKLKRTLDPEGLLNPGKLGL
jgi:FAD/FMN-containing dehydrogenase